MLWKRLSLTKKIFFAIAFTSTVAEIEALQDGVHQPTTDVLSGLHRSVMRLARLVGDLNTLSRTARRRVFAGVA